MLTLKALAGEDAPAYLPALSALLLDSLEHGAAVGFMLPLPASDARAYWQDVFAAVAAGRRVLLVAEADGQVAGSVQLALAEQNNGQHRAEVCKMLVHSSWRRRGIARQLLQALEDHARHHQRTTLVLDTRQGDAAEHLYQSVGYTRAGEIPDFARSSSGELHATVLYYKLLPLDKA
ncbi:GNAT family N-acetyltransferase [Hymenobacter busanensis]|uniref:GNAT family N-acetyltransferase n=1 Tax=Hymenobacter busanensis TaxID=2607656 RepID=A0A7L5A042_9BACT|nr:GNAT family N-acetyltransferase [Hymenobacter busanensis]KAA9325556.1 GNAT family N-acetyltransferase [Hymenobacter busanensis]QHJ07772.1 GNAT family N-acetyltransferase [Hymenobacter busanensis]